MAKTNRRVLVIPDMHMPYCHPDTWRFLAALKRKFKPDRIVCLGDEVDGHAISFHESDPDLDSAGPELQKAKNLLKKIYELFPNCDVLESNHGSLVYRKAKAAGIPRQCLRSYREMLEAPPGWLWHTELTIKMSDGNYVYFTHGKTSHILNLSKSVSMSAACGHYHEKFSINYWANSRGLYWQLNCGALIDDKALAFAYNKLNLHRPLIGAAIIIDGQPMLIPLLTTKNGRWIGKL